MKILTMYRAFLSLIFASMFANTQICAMGWATPLKPHKFTITNNAGRRLHLSVDTKGCGSPYNDHSLENGKSVSYSNPDPARGICTKINVIAWDDSKPAHVYKDLGFDDFRGGYETIWTLEFNESTGLTSAPRTNEILNLPEKNQNED